MRLMGRKEGRKGVSSVGGFRTGGPGRGRRAFFQDEQLAREGGDLGGVCARLFCDLGGGFFVFVFVLYCPLILN